MSESEDYDKILQEVRRRYNEYENQRVICVALKRHIDSVISKNYKGKKIQVWLEPEITPVIKKENQPFKTPDLLLRVDSKWLVLDYKQIESRDRETLTSHVNGVLQYQQEFIINHSFSKDKKIKTTENFIPCVSIICPREVAQEFSKIANSVTIFDAKDGSKISFSKVVDRLSDRELAKIFESELEITKNTRDLAMIRFLRQKPQTISYTALIVVNNLANADGRAYADPIEAPIKNVVDILKELFPPYLKTVDGFDRDQVTKERVIEAANFLNEIGFADYKDDMLIMKRSTGRLIPDLLEHLQKKEADLIFIKRQKEEREEVKSPEPKTKKGRRFRKAKASPDDQSLERWLH